MPTTGINNSATPFAQPTLRRLGKRAETALLEMRGDLDDSALEMIPAIVRQIRADKRIDWVMLGIDCQHAEFSPSIALTAADALTQLARSRMLFCFIENCVGALPYLLATSCTSIAAAPAARIGQFEVSARGKPDDTLSAWFEYQFEERRPRIRPAFLAECASGLITGEAAASKWLAGVDGIENSVEHFLWALFSLMRGHPK